jgi:hypothetical protein
MLELLREGDSGEAATDDDEILERRLGRSHGEVLTVGE